ncbi:MAG: hypothetical protein D6718_02085 [Acidobacteria bacterium]|nr:MAG: hypothetical protein D6718_02085 [Acidobacteriota bacterium]
MSIPHNDSPHRERGGSALIVVILLALFASAIAGTMIVMSNADHRIAANERDAERALFASKAGLNYAYYLFTEGLIQPTPQGTAFNSYDADVSAALEGAEFSGKIYDISAVMDRGQLYRIESTGVMNKATRTTELVFQIIPEAFKYGYTAFNQAVLHNHSGLAGPTFKIESTIFSNGTVDIPQDITLDGAVVAAGTVTMATGSVVKKDIFANALVNDGTVEGNVKTLTAVNSLPATAPTWDRIDALGNKYEWYNGASSPGTVSGSGTVLGTIDSYTVADGDNFVYSIFRKDGSLIADPDLNVIKFIPPPKIDYKAMKEEADLGDPTYFNTMSEAINYFITKKVTETIAGKTVTTVKIGTPSQPEWIYVRDNLTITLDPTQPDDPSTGVIQADGFHIEGGIYATGSMSFNGPAYDPAIHPPTPDWYQFKINALPYCYPALVAYPEPSTGTIDTWTPNDTPPMTTGNKIEIKSNFSPHEGFWYIHGLAFSGGEIHAHHTQSSDELIRFIGAEMAWKVHNCDYFWFTYDPAVRCTKFLVADEGTPDVVSYREVR